MAITGGKYLVGENGDYATLSAAITDIDANIYTNLEFVVISPFTDTGLAAFKDIQFGNPNLTLKITSPVDPKGKPICSFQISLTGTRQQYFGFNTIGTRTGTIIIQHLNIKNIDQPSSLPSYQVAFTAASPYTQQHVQVRNCIFDGGGYDNTQGLRLSGDCGNKVWNCIFRDMPGSGSYGIRCYGKGDADNEPSRIDNCVFHEIDHAIRYNANEYYTNNCIGFGGSNPFTDAVGLNDDTKANSHGNVSDYSAIPWDEPRSKVDADVADEFISVDPTNKDFMVPVSGSYLETFGALPIIDLNTTDVEGGARPGSAHTMCTGVMGRREELRQYWNSVRKFTIDGSKIKVSTGSIQLCLTQVAPGMTDILKTAKSDGGDIRITTDRWGWEELPVEVAQWDPVNEKCMVWFKPAAVVAGEDYSCYVWYGNDNADHVPLNDDHGQWAVWEDYNLVVHCLEDPIEDGYVKDSSSKMHYGVWTTPQSTTWQDGLADGGAVGKSYKGKTPSLSDTAFIELPEGDYVNGDNYVQASYFAVHNGTSNAAFLQLGPTGAGRRFTTQILATSPQAIVYAPDGASQSSGSASGAATKDVPLFVGMHIDLVAVTKFLRWFKDGQFLEQDTLAGATGAFTDADSSWAAIGTNEGQTGVMEGRVQELWLHNTERSDGFQETFYENLENGDTFFKTPTFVNQKGARDILFSTPAGESGDIHLDATDFYITYSRRVDGSMSFILNAVWEATGLDEDWGITRRLAIEARLRELARMMGKRGDLTIGPDYPETIENVVLDNVNATVVDNNTSIEYSLEFTTNSQVTSIARSIVFNGKRIDALDFIVEYEAADRTQFKPVFRAAPVRIESGPPLQIIRIVGMIALTGTEKESLAARQRVETFIKDWVNNHQGQEGTLEIDGVDQGTAHLGLVVPSDMSYFDRVGVELEFVTGYGS